MSKDIINMRQFQKMKFKGLEFTGKWRMSFGLPSQGFRMLIKGAPKNGKTEFCTQLAMYMTDFGKVFYFSKEQGASKSLYACFQRNNAFKNRKLILGDKSIEFVRLLEILKTNRIKTLFLDSVNYLNLTENQYKILDEQFPNINLIFVSWKDKNKQGKGKTSFSIGYMGDIIVDVEHFVANVETRFNDSDAPPEPFIIWQEGAKRYHTFLNQGGYE